ncbi:hypothetical protein VCHA38O206_90047 [Vibrio chagasii]|nr:hypothetical protein VCHA35P150_90173 [Vibrio chagasii]CAH7428050.1 hypothetical protein VCHA38O206_90047 [Vibrio chagasii]
MKYGEKHVLLPVGAKPKGGSVPECEFIVSSSEKIVFWVPIGAVLRK